MALNPLAGKPAPASLLIDPAKLERDYYTKQPDTADWETPASRATSTEVARRRRGLGLT